jgi:hypothetical protein
LTKISFLANYKTFFRSLGQEKKAGFPAGAGLSSVKKIYRFYPPIPKKLEIPFSLVISTYP